MNYCPIFQFDFFYKERVLRICPVLTRRSHIAIGVFAIPYTKAILMFSYHNHVGHPCFFSRTDSLLNINILKRIFIRKDDAISPFLSTKVFMPKCINMSYFLLICVFDPLFGFSEGTGRISPLSLKLQSIRTALKIKSNYIIRLV